MKPEIEKEEAMNTIIRMPAVSAAVQLSQSTIYAWMAEGKFPKSFPLGGRAVGWLRSEIDEWIRGCAAQRDGQ